MLEGEALKAELGQQIREWPPIGPYPVAVSRVQDRIYRIGARQQKFHYSSIDEPFRYKPLDMYSPEEQRYLGWNFITIKRLSRFPLFWGKRP